MFPVVAAVSARQRGEFKRWIWVRGIVCEDIIVLLRQPRKSIQHLVPRKESTCLPRTMFKFFWPSPASSTINWSFNQLVQLLLLNHVRSLRPCRTAGTSTAEPAPQKTRTSQIPTAASRLPPSGPIQTVCSTPASEARQLVPALTSAGAEAARPWKTRSRNDPS